MTHLGSDNLYGLSAVLQRKATENVHPEIGFMYLNVSDKLKAIQDGGEGGKENGNLMVNLADEGNKVVEYAKQTLGEFPHPCSRSQSGHSVEPINLYHKVGIGSLDMYILNPITDSKELKDFYQQWNQKVAQFGIHQHVPLPNTLSVCALLVWRPSNPNDNITRIFFPGNAPQNKIMEGLEKLKNLDILKHAQCSKTSLATKPAPKKPALGSKPPTARSKVSPVQTPKQETAPKKEVSKPEPRAAPKPRPASAPKTKKEITNKKTSKENEKTDKAKSSTSSSPSKASTKSATPTTPKSIVSPVQEPAKPIPAKEPEPAPAPVVKQEPKPEPIPEPAPVVPAGGDADLLGLDSSVDPPQLVDVREPMAPKHEDLEPAISDSPAPLPEPGYGHAPEPAAPPTALGKDQLLELGVYDEDQDIEQHLNAQQQQPDMFGGMADSMHEDLQPPVQPAGGFSDLMTTSMHESMYVDREQFGEQPQPQNGLILTPDDEDSEEIQPQALPEPVAYAPASYGQEPDVIPTMPVKESAVPKPEPQAFAEPDLLPVKQEPEDLDEQSTARIEDELSGANDTYDKHFEDKEMESPDEVSKLPLDKEFPATTREAEKHLSKDEGFEQDQFKEDEIEEKDVTEETEKMVPTPVPEVQKTAQREMEPEKGMLESDTIAVQDEEEKIAALPRPPFAPVDDVAGIEDAKFDENKEEEELIPEKPEPVQTSVLSGTTEDKIPEGGPMEDLDDDTESQEVGIEDAKFNANKEKEELIPETSESVQTSMSSETTAGKIPEGGPMEDLDDDAESQEVAGFELEKTDPALESPSVSPILDTGKVVKTESKIEDDFGQIQQEPSEPLVETLQQQAESPVDQLQQEKLEDYDFRAQQRESPEMMLESDQKSEEDLESPSVSPILDTEKEVVKTESKIEDTVGQIQQEPSEPLVETLQQQAGSPVDQLQQEKLEDYDFRALQRESPEMMLESDQKSEEDLESPSVSPILDTEKEVVETEPKIEDAFGQIQQKPSEPLVETLQQQAESPVDQLQQEKLEDYDFRAQQRESPEMMLESDQKSEEDLESHSRELSESPDMLGHVEQDVERPKTPEPEDIEAIENIGDKEQEFSHEGTPDSIENQQEDKDLIENNFAGSHGIVGGETKEQNGMIETEEEKENVEPALEQKTTQQLLEEVNRDSLEREPMPVPAEFQDDQRDSVERDEEEDEEDEEEEEDSSEEEESQSQSTSYEEEEASDQKCLIQDSVSEDQKVKVAESKDVEGSMGAAGHVDSLGVDSQPSDSLLTPESEGTDQSYHQIGEQDDVDSFEGMDQVSSMPAQQDYSAPLDFGHPPAEPSGVSTNPFDIDGQPGFDQLMGTQNQPMQPQHGNPFEDSSDDEVAERGPARFDPLAEWGQPMGLPSPSPPDSKTSGATSDKKSPKDKGAKPSELKKPEAKKAPGSASKTKPAPPQAAKAPKQSNGVPEKSKRLSGTSNPSRLSTGGASNALNTSRLSTDRKPTASKTRPASAPVKDKTDTKTDTKRPATASGKSSMGTTTKMPPLPPFIPFYVDLTYIPNHGNPQYSDVEFFKRIRARYYVLSALSPNPQILDALLEAKKTWDDQQLPVTIIPTYDNETLRHWMGLHKDLLSDMKVEVAPSASRCTIQLQDHETSSSAYRLEF